MKRLQPRIDSLGLARWRREVDSHLLEYVKSDHDSDDYEAYRAFAVASKLLSKYEQLERISLLELAVWKASLQSDPFFETMDDLDAYWTLDRDFDPVK